MGFDVSTFNQATNFLSNLNTFNQKHEILTVNSLQQVKDFVVNKGDSYLLLDPNADTLYIKECDSIGKINLRCFALTETTQDVINNTTPVTISKSDYEKLIKRLDLLEKGGRNGTAESKQPELDFTDK